MKELQPIVTGPLFPEIRTELVSLLKALKEEEWRLPTAAGKWNVKDVALHILGGDLGNLSRRRDGFALAADLSSYEKLVAFINEINASWVLAGQRMSPRVITDLLEHAGRQADEYFAGLDPYTLGQPVSWAGPERVPVWFDVAREYTERWHHQQQIRDATGRPGLYERRLFEPVMDTFVRALPNTFRSVQAREGIAVGIVTTGATKKKWSLVRGARQWALYEGSDENPPAADGGRYTEVAVVTIASETAWKIFTKGIRGAEALQYAEIAGERRLGEKVLETVSVIA